MRLPLKKMNQMEMTDILKRSTKMWSLGSKRPIRSGTRFAGLGQDSSKDIVNQVLTGSIFPDEIGGVSVKTILVGLVLLMLIKRD